MRPERTDRGTVTAETAVALPVLALLLSLCLWAVGAVVLQLRCIDAAKTAARQLARGEPVADVRGEAVRVAPQGAVVRLRQSGDFVVADVQVQATMPGPWGDRGPGVLVRGRAVAAVESRLWTVGPGR